MLMHRNVLSWSLWLCWKALDECTNVDNQEKHLLNFYVMNYQTWSWILWNKLSLISHQSRLSQIWGRAFPQKLLSILSKIVFQRKRQVESGGLACSKRRLYARCQVGNKTEACQQYPANSLCFPGVSKLIGSVILANFASDVFTPSHACHTRHILMQFWFHIICFLVAFYGLLWYLAEDT